MYTTLNVLAKYKKLSIWCEKFCKKTFVKYADDIACHAGCGICCELQSVNLLEAFSIFSSGVCGAVPVKSDNDGKCVFLHDDKCSIYDNRPLVCRTHGLAIKSREFTSAYSITCPYNFRETDFDKRSDFILDMDIVTENMMRLNYAFCIMTNLRHLESERILLCDIANSQFTPEIAQAFSSCL